MQQLLALQSFRAETMHHGSGRRRPFQRDQADDATRLAELWAILKPDAQQIVWTDIGFQGADATTDFRALGIMALDALLFFARHHRRIAVRLVQECDQPNNKWFSFAITYINLVFDVLTILHDAPELFGELFLFYGPPYDITLYSIAAVLFVRFHSFPFGNLFSVTVSLFLIYVIISLFFYLSINWLQNAVDAVSTSDEDD